MSQRVCCSTCRLVHVCQAMLLPLQTSKNLFILVPSLLGALLTLMALAICGLFPRYVSPLCCCMWLPNCTCILIRLHVHGHKCVWFTDNDMYARFAPSRLPYYMLNKSRTLTALEGLHVFYVQLVACLHLPIEASKAVLLTEPAVMLITALSSHGRLYPLLRVYCRTHEPQTPSQRQQQQFRNLERAVELPVR